MRYLVVGAGGTGGCIAGFLAKGGKDVTLVARGENLAAIREKGIVVDSSREGAFQVACKACTAEEYNGTPDVVFVCVKAYSLGELTGFLDRVCGRDTVVIPILNCFGTGERLARSLKNTQVLDGCIYIFAERSAPGSFVQRGAPFRIVFGLRSGQAPVPGLEAIRQELEDCRMDAVLSQDIQKDIFLKMSYVSPMAGTGSFYNATAGEICANQEMLALFSGMVGEIQAVAKGHGIRFDQDLVALNVKNIQAAAPEATTSLHRDLQQGGPNELDAILFELVRLGRAAGVPVPNYERISRHFGFKE